MIITTCLDTRRKNIGPSTSEDPFIEPNIEGRSKPLKMGQEELYWAKREEAIVDFLETQKNSDLKELEKKKFSIEKQLFGIGNQYTHSGISLDSKYFGDICYQLKTDHMLPLIPPNTDLLLKFCNDFAYGEICVYRYREDTYCHQIIKENGKLLAKSLNKNYKTIELNPNEYFFIGVISSVHYSVRMK